MKEDKGNLVKFPIPFSKQLEYHNHYIKRHYQMVRRALLGGLNLSLRIDLQWASRVLSMLWLRLDSEGMEG